MSFQHPVTKFICSHENQEEFDVLDWLGFKITLCLCKNCQSIPEFSDILNHNKTSGKQS